MALSIAASMHCVAQFAHVKAAGNTLHAEGCSADLFVLQGFTPLHAAMRRNGQNIVEVVALLVQAGATADSADKLHWQVSCLHSLYIIRLWHGHAGNQLAGCQVTEFCSSFVMLLSRA